MIRKCVPWNFPKRFVLVIMVFIGYIFFFGLHTNIAMAVVEMTSVKKVSYANDTTELKQEYNWDPSQKALVLGSFSYGRLLGPIGGVLVSRLGGSTVFGFGTLAVALITFFTPIFLHINFYLFVATTALTGTFDAFTVAGVSQLWSRWIPPDERAKVISLSLIGMYAGPIVSYIVSGWILSSWNWMVLFYVSGIATFVWCGIWWLVVSDDPSTDKCISSEELIYIQSKLNSAAHNEKVIYPWKDIFTCLPFWCGCLCKFTIGCGFIFSTMYLPQYIKDTNNMDIKGIGFVSVIPMLGSLVSLPLAGFLFDHIRSNKILSLTNNHKFFISTAFFTAAATYIVAGLWSNFVVCVICLSVFQFFSTFAVLDILVLFLDLAPRYAAFMNTVAVSFFSVAGFITPIFVSFIVTSHSKFQWSICFFTFGGIFICTASIFLKFGSGELQHWANHSSNNSSPNSIQPQDAPAYSECA